MVIRQLDQTRSNKDISHNFGEREHVFESIFRVIRVIFSKVYLSISFRIE